MILAIVTEHYNWYCKACGRKHKVLYKTDRKNYCDGCVPESVKSQAVRVNQNREEI